MKSFLGWMESEESPALSEPQHKSGESNMKLDALVERRMKQIIMDLESSGKGTQQEILSAVGKYLQSKGVEQKQPDQSQPDKTQQPNQMQPGQPQPGQTQMTQGQNQGAVPSVI